jgi:hypothetical protein
VIDVGLSSAYGGRLACLAFEEGKPYVLHRGQKLPLPIERGERLIEYLESAAALDPQPSPLEAIIRCSKGLSNLQLSR